MAIFKFIEPTRLVVRQMQNDLYDADCLAQGAEAKIGAATHSICLMLKEPDSGQMRLRIKALCDIIEYHVFDVMNTINAAAERHGANFISELERKEESLIHAAASPTETGVNEPNVQTH